MRSLTVKLTLAFLLVGTTGALLVALLVSQRTRSEFNRFLSERDQAVLVDALDTYYAAHGGWDDVSTTLFTTSPFDMYSRGVTLVDANNVVVFGRGPFQVGTQAPADVLSTSTPIEVNGQKVGALLVPSPNDRGPNDRPPPDIAFLDRVTWAASISAGVAALIALILGILLARTLSRPVRELTAATQAMARGKLDQRVLVRSRDEIGELAASFNQMSTDLARASQLRKQMTADLAHDLRTPLSILRGYTEGLQDGRLNGNPKLFTIMHGEVEHLQRLVEDLRVLSLADAGELPLNKRSVDPRALLERAGLAYIMEAEQQGVALRVETPDDLPSISVDTDRMAQVLNNLVSNALRYTHAGEIVLQAQASDEQVQLQVSDTGSGIAAEDLPFIFDRFYRADKSRQRSDSATSGLGLAITKAIVEAHDGSISASSLPDRGTTFTITLPTAASLQSDRTNALDAHQSLALPKSS